MKKINNNELNIKNVGQEVTLFGFLANKRTMGEITFIDLRDRWGITQIIIKNKVDLTKESVLEIKGIVVERKDKNPNLKTGDIEIDASEIKVLSKAKSELPFIISDHLEAKDNTKLKYRFLDLRRPKMQNIIKTRHRFIKSVRDFLDEKDFLEIETPILSKSTPEGARDFLVPTRKKGDFFALPQSPQLYKQLLMISGMERYFQVVKSFRDEDSRKDRQPEFTQLDIEISYTSIEEIISLMEDMLRVSLNKIDINISKTIPKMDYDYAIDNYGTDKPDLRYGLKLIDIQEYFKNSEFNVLKNAKNIKSIFIEKTLSNKQIKKLEEIAKKNGAKGLLWASQNKDQEKKGPGFKFIEKEINLIIEEKFNNKKEWSLLIVGDDYNSTTQSLGSVRVALNEMFNLASDKNEFVWIVNWPMFEYDNDTKRYQPLHHAFTSPQDEYLDNIIETKGEARAKSYDLVWNGYEIGGGSIRNNDSDIQKNIFAAMNLSQVEVNEKFGFFLDAFDYGVPPHGGIAFGVDRIIMIATKSDSIRDVIAFPKNQNGIAVMENSPATIGEEQLEEYGILIDKKKEEN